jgi:alpha-N-arabinofuranosidase
MLDRRGLMLGGSAILASAVAGRAMAVSPRNVLTGGVLDVDVDGPAARVSPLIFGQFIEFLDRAIDGGVFEKGSALSDARGFRRDVLDKVQGLKPAILRYPGGTVTKIYHWEDGIGPAAGRPVRPNLIWTGVIDNQFGTDEFVEYARAVGAEPFITVSMGVGTAEEASNWVEYCNGTAKTSYAEKRRRNGFDAPHNVKYWGLGNEEEAVPDAGRLQDVNAYTKEAWLYTKLMKLQDPGIKLIAAGGAEAWNAQVIRELHPAIDYISAHLYPKSEPGEPLSIVRSADGCEATILALKRQVRALAPEKVSGFSEWYRFPPRQEPLMIALDEIGIWEPGGQGAYGMENTYTWGHALATATLYNILIRHADIVGLATWAQTVNVLAPIMTSKDASIRQTIYHAMAFMRRHCGDQSLAVQCTSPAIGLAGAEAQSCLDASATLHSADGTLSLIVVNRHPDKAVEAVLPKLKRYSRMTVHELTAPAWGSQNTLDKPNIDVVMERSKPSAAILASYSFPPRSITALQLV